MQKKLRLCLTREEKYWTAQLLYKATTILAKLSFLIYNLINKRFIIKTIMNKSTIQKYR